VFGGRVRKDVMALDTVSRFGRPVVRRLTRDHVWVARGEFLGGLRVRGGLGFRNPPAPMTAEQRFLTGLSLDGCTVFDVGGFNGHLTWFFAQRARRVITFEPNPVNYLAILEMVALNGLENVQVLNVAVGAVSGTATLFASSGLDATGSLDQGIAAARGGACREFEVSMVSLDEMSRIFAPDFVKIDVEGHEAAVLNGAVEMAEACHPDFHVEIHGAGTADKQANARAVVGWLGERGYLCRHVETDQPVSSTTADTARTGHVFASTRRPADVELDTEGLTARVRGLTELESACAQQ
jgi:FkbM family methyltransferase